MKSRSPGASHEIWWLSGRGMKSRSTPLPAYRNGMLFDNSLNDKRFRIDIRTENGYEEGCKRGAKAAKSASAFPRNANTFPALFPGYPFSFWSYPFSFPPLPPHLRDEKGSVPISAGGDLLSLLLLPASSSVSATTYFRFPMGKVLRYAFTGFPESG